MHVSHPTACTPIANSVGPVTCTSAQDSKGDAAHGFAPLHGFWLNATGAADTCVGMWCLPNSLTLQYTVVCGCFVALASVTQSQDKRTYYAPTCSLRSPTPGVFPTAALLASIPRTTLPCLGAPTLSNNTGSLLVTVVSEWISPGVYMQKFTFLCLYSLQHARASPTATTPC